MLGKLGIQMQKTESILLPRLLFLTLNRINAKWINERDTAASWPNFSTPMPNICYSSVKGLVPEGLIGKLL